MYNYMKLLQPVAEEVGTVICCECMDMSEVFNDLVKFSGTTDNGYAFELVLMVMKHDRNKS